MYTKKRLFSSIASFSAVVALSISAPVFAERSLSTSGHEPAPTTQPTTQPAEHSAPSTTTGDSAGPDNPVDKAGTSHGGTQPTTSKAEVEATSTDDQKPEANETTQHEMHVKGEQKVAELRKDHKEHTADERQKFCNLHKDDITTGVSTIKARAQSLQDRITEVLAKGVAFKTTHHLSPTNYDAQLATVSSDKAASSVAIANLVAPTLDCTSATVATEVATFKVSAETSRDALKTYRADVKALIQAIKAAAVAASSTSTTTATTPATEGTN
jgi:hypothetical protein